jgi:hypothetical protein
MCHRFDILESFFWQRPDFSIILQKPLPLAHNLPEGGKITQAIKDKVIRLAARPSAVGRL